MESRSRDDLKGTTLKVYRYIIKSIGLLLGTVRPTSADLSIEVSHSSLLGLLLRMPELLETLPKVQDTARKALDKPEIKALGLSQAFDPILQKPNVSPEQARTAVAQVRNARKAGASIAWRATLELDPKHEATKKIMDLLKEADLKCKQADEALALFKPIYKKYRKYLSDPWFLEYALNLNKAVSELTPLGVVSMWHEKETRYPSLRAFDYWDPAAYSEEKGLIRNFPELHRHLIRFSKSTLSAARAALKSLESNPRRDIPK